MEQPTGKLSLVFRKKAGEKTYLARQYFKLPLQVLTPHYQEEDGTAFVYLLNPSGGVLQHDRLLTEITLEEKSRAVITTPSSTKFYKMDEGCAKVSNRFTVAKDAVLEYMPEYNVPFAQSKSYQQTDFYLDRGATLIACDAVTAGRVSRDEIFRYDRYASRTRIYVDGKLMVYDNSCIEPRSMNLEKKGLMEGHLINGTIYVYSPEMRGDLSDQLNQICGGSIRFGAGNIDDSLVVIRLLGDHMIDFQNTVAALWAVLRRELLDKPAAKIRKY